MTHEKTVAVAVWREDRFIFAISAEREREVLLRLTGTVAHQDARRRLLNIR
jgi:hypothetical protein